MATDCREIFNAIERLTEIDPDLARDLLACFEDTKRPQFWDAARRLGHMEGAKSAYVAAMEAVDRTTF